jgi:hypothetical protein
MPEEKVHRGGEEDKVEAIKKRHEDDTREIHAGEAERRHFVSR